MVLKCGFRVYLKTLVLMLSGYGANAYCLFSLFEEAFIITFQPCNPFNAQGNPVNRHLATTTSLPVMLLIG
jgi:hypothetical protein